MISTPFVFIHILNYNGGEEILRCLASLRQLTYPSFQVIVIDNASTDNSLTQIQSEFPEVTIIKNTRNLGFGAGHTIGIQKALAEKIPYVWLLNQDTVVAPDALGHLINKCEVNPTLGAVSPLILHPDNTVWFANGRIDWWRMRAIHTRATAGIPDYLSGCALLLRSEVFAQSVTFDEQYFLYYEDVDLSLQLKKLRFKLLVEPKARVWHTETSASRPLIKTLWLVWSGLLFFSKNTPWWWRPWVQFYFFLRVFYNKIFCFYQPTPIRCALREIYRFFLHTYGYHTFLFHSRQLPQRTPHPPMDTFITNTPT